MNPNTVTQIFSSEDFTRDCCGDRGVKIENKTSSPREVGRPLLFSGEEGHPIPQLREPTRIRGFSREEEKDRLSQKGAVVFPKGTKIEP